MKRELILPHQWAEKEIKIALVGCGGTGAEILDELYRIDLLLKKLGGEGFHVDAFDPDTVSSANLGRSRFWPCDLDFHKSEVLITRLNSYGGTQWRYINEKFDAKYCEHYDLIITAADNPEIRAQIGEIEWASEEETLLWLDCGNGAHDGNVILGHLCCDDEQRYIPNVYDLYPMLSTMIVKNEPSCSTEAAILKQDYGINRSVAREGANLLWQLFRHGRLDHHGSYIDIKAGTVCPLLIDEDQWAVYGFQSAQAS